MAQTQWGRWSFDRRGDEIADIACDDVTVLRSIRAVVRDHNWATGELRITRVSEVSGALTLSVSCTDLGADIHGTVRVHVVDDAITVTFDAESRSVFLSNRVGLVVLHPHRLSGTALRVAHPDGSSEETGFPLAVSPHQPVFNIRALSWVHDGLDIEVAFSGDVFEMEDQRNWTDASFKTYSRPLSLPFPYEITAGERVVQQVTVRASGDSVRSTAGDEATIALQPGGLFPQIQLGASSAPDPAPKFEPLGTGVLVELDLASTNWRAALERAASAGLPLDVRLTAPAAPDAQWGTTTPGAISGDALRESLSNAVVALTELPVLRIAAFDPISHTTEPALTAALRAALTQSATVLEGARSHFTELNREQDRTVTDADADAVTFALTPLFHTLGEEQLYESIAVQRVLAAQALTISGGRAVHVGPVALRPRFNNVATVPEPAPSSEGLDEGYGAQLTGAVDERLSTADIAAWTIASAAALAMPGVESITYFEQWGPRGIVSATGVPHPVAAAIRALSALASDELLSGESPDGLLWAVGSRNATGMRVLAANLDTTERALTIAVPDAEETRVVIPARSWLTQI